MKPSELWVAVANEILLRKGTGGDTGWLSRVQARNDDGVLVLALPELYLPHIVVLQSLVLWCVQRLLKREIEVFFEDFERGQRVQAHWVRRD